MQWTPSQPSRFGVRHPAVTTVLVGARSKEHLMNALEAEQTAFKAEWHREIASWDAP